MTVNGQAPAGTAAVAVWFWTSTGGNLENCTLTSSGGSPGEQTYRKSVELVRSWGRGIQIDGYMDDPGYSGAGTDERFLIEGTESGSKATNWRAAFDGRYLYLATRMETQGLQDSYTADGSVWNDNGFTVMFNTGNESTVGFDQNDFLRLYGVGEGEGLIDPVKVEGISSRLFLSDVAACRRGDNPQRGVFPGTTNCEVRFNLQELGIDIDQFINEIGFNIQWFFDDDGGDLDAHYSWCSGGTIDSWRNMSVIDCSLKLRRTRNPDYVPVVRLSEPTCQGSSQGSVSLTIFEVGLTNEVTVTLASQTQTQSADNSGAEFNFSGLANGTYTISAIGTPYPFSYERTVNIECP